MSKSEAEILALDWLKQKHLNEFEELISEYGEDYLPITLDDYKESLNLRKAESSIKKITIGIFV